MRGLTGPAGWACSQVTVVVHRFAVGTLLVTMVRLLHLSYWVLAAFLLSACTRFSPASREWTGVETGVTATCEDPSSDRCIVFACD